METIIVVTELPVKNEALQLKKHQDSDARLLQCSQSIKALNLVSWQKTHLLLTLEDSQKRAAHELNVSQQEAAGALKLSQEADAVILKDTKDAFAQKLDETNQMIHWLSGGYSIEKEKV